MVYKFFFDIDKFILNMKVNMSEMKIYIYILKYVLIIFGSKVYGLEKKNFI